MSGAPEETASTEAEAPKAEDPPAEAPGSEASGAPAPAEPAPSVTPAPEAPAGDDRVSPLTWVVLLGLLAVVVYSLIPRGDASGLPSGNDVQALLSEGRATAKRSGEGGGVEGALPFFRKAVVVAPEDPTANGTLGRALVELARYDEALSFLQKAKQASPSVYEVNLYLGMCLTGLERHSEARPLLEEALQIRPEDPQPLYYLGVGAMRLRELEKTIDYLGRYVVKAPKNLLALRMYADALDASGRGAEAIAALTKLVAMTPGDVPARRALHTRRLRAEGLEPVLADAAADAEREKGPEALYLYARLLCMAPDRAAQARSALERLKTEFPQVVRADLDLATEDIRDGDLDGARARLKAVLKTAPRSVEARALLADVAVQAKAYDEARTLLDGLLAGQLNAHAELGILTLLLEQGKGEEATAFAEGLLRGAAKGDPRRWALEGDLHKSLGRFDEARAVLKELIAEGRDQDRVIWLGYVGFVELEAGDDAAAHAAFESLFESAGDVTLPPDVLLWAGVAARSVDAAAAEARWRQAASGPDYDSLAFHTRGAKRILGEATREELLAGARLAGYQHLNDALYFEGLALERSGDAARAKQAYEEALAASRGDEFPARLIRRALKR